jgi:hypothetical protein
MKSFLFLLLMAASFTTAHAQALFGVVTSQRTAYVFYRGNWQTAKQLNGTNPKLSGTDEAVGIMTGGSGSNSYGYVFSNGHWSPDQGFSGDPIGITTSKGLIGFLTSRFGYVCNNGQWMKWQQVLSTETPKGIVAKNGYIFLITNISCYTFDSNTNAWQRQPLNGLIDYTH